MNNQETITETENNAISDLLQMNAKLISHYNLDKILLEKINYLEKQIERSFKDLNKHIDREISNLRRIYEEKHSTENTGLPPMEDLLKESAKLLADPDFDKILLEKLNDLEKRMEKSINDLNRNIDAAAFGLDWEISNLRRTYEQKHSTQFSH